MFCIGKIIGSISKNLKKINRKQLHKITYEVGEMVAFMSSHGNRLR